MNIIITVRFQCCGMKDRTVVASDCRKKLICGMERKNIVAYGRLPPPSFLQQEILGLVGANEETFNKVVNDSS